MTQQWVEAEEEALLVTEVLNLISRRPNRPPTAINGTNGVPRSEIPMFGFPEEEKEWRKDALCRGLDSGTFYPSKGDSMLPAYAVCRGCPVRTECLDSAITRGERFGVWAGYTPQERKKIQREAQDQKVSYQKAAEPYDQKRDRRLHKAMVRMGWEKD